MLILLASEPKHPADYELFSIFLTRIPAYMEVELRAWVHTQPFEVFEFYDRPRAYYMDDPNIFLLIKMMFPEVNYYISCHQPKKYDEFMVPIRAINPV